MTMDTSEFGDLKIDEMTPEQKAAYVDGLRACIREIEHHHCVATIIAAQAIARIAEEYGYDIYDFTKHVVTYLKPILRKNDLNMLLDPPEGSA